ncbi:14318_t:CDS:2 [Ambispora leptoticha]|uniref:14318_t:CDS:1 n=1 Tax=Ambispora leptoticha TaxID=144679 RepID=A0A9N9AIX7_9GLOM|nr:14318_t:CDS:2 [Ambispora leptoticha]
MSLQKEDVVKLSLSAYNVNIREATHERYNYYVKLKERINRKLANSAELYNPNWDVNVNVICVVGGNDFRPDVGIWFRTLTFAQISRSIVNLCPPPRVFYNKNPDHDHALSKIDNQNPGLITTPATPTPAIPTRTPYIVQLWNVNSIPVYYIMNWNEHLVLNCGWIIEFNVVLDVISRS